MPVSNFRHHSQLFEPEILTVYHSAKDQQLIAAPAVIRAKPAVTNNKEEKNKERKRVTFQENVRVRPTVHLDDMTDEEISNVWFCRKDFNSIKRAVATTVKIISHQAYNEAVHDNDQCCSRGLEYRVRSGALARKENKRHGTEAVLDEQDRQCQYEITDDERIRQLFQKATVHCRVSALQMGLRDEHEAKMIHEEDKEQCGFNDNLGDDSCSSDEDMDYCIL